MVYFFLLLFTCFSINASYKKELFKALRDEVLFWELFEEHKVSPNEIDENNGESLLMVAANYPSCFKTIEYLLDEEDIDLNIRCNEGWNAFLNACYEGNKKAAQLLYNCGVCLTG